MAFLYKLTNKVNGRYKVGIYSGKITLLKLFWCLTDINRPCFNKKLKDDIIKYGRDNFIIESLLNSNDPVELNSMLDKIFSYDYSKKKFYLRNHMTLKKSEEIKKKMSDKKIGNKPSDLARHNRTIGQQNRFSRLPKNCFKKIHYILHNNVVYCGTKESLSTQLNINMECIIRSKNVMAKYIDYKHITSDESKKYITLHLD